VIRCEYCKQEIKKLPTAKPKQVTWESMAAGYEWYRKAEQRRENLAKYREIFEFHENNDGV
jgi:hypothetical protein